jgi:hypothetical protein
MSMRMLPDSRISPVVLPSAPILCSAGLTSSFSTVSKSMPFRVPKGRMMKALMRFLSTNDPRFSSLIAVLIGDPEHAGDAAWTGREGRCLLSQTRGAPLTTRSHCSPTVVAARTRRSSAPARVSHSEERGSSHGSGYSSAVLAPHWAAVGCRIRFCRLVELFVHREIMGRFEVGIPGRMVTDRRSAP